MTRVKLNVRKWVAYGFSLWWLLPDLELSLASAAGVVAAFALAHAAGVLLIVAPAGLGAREGVLIALLVPMVGVPSAAAAALLARLVHALADFLIAGAAAAWARSAREPPGRDAVWLRCRRTQG